MAAIGATGSAGDGLASTAAATAFAPPPPSTAQAPAPASVGGGNASIGTGFDGTVVDTGPTASCAGAYAAWSS
jgi:hypothetical protein